ncbi:MAG: LysR family transcriptional regulator substrate-binding protein, partial [Angelakisella sp.]
ENRADIGVILLSHHTEPMIKKILSVKKLQFHPLIKAVPHAYFRECHPLASQKSVALNDLLKYPYAAFGQENNGLVDFAEEIALLDIKTLPQTIYVYDRATFYNIVSHTDAFSIGSGIIPQGFGDEGIVTLPISDHTEQMQLGWIKRSDASSTESMERFIKFLEKEIL